ncbi:MAG: AMP-binding protein [Ignavibacteriaceae bacterium]|nr:AMP-binding protein [Ignavibacteriaceae bacterium]
MNQKNSDPIHFWSAHLQTSGNKKNSTHKQDLFWKELTDDIFWFKRPIKTLSGKGKKIKWFLGGKTNISYNCLDIHLNTSRQNKAALIWESESGLVKTFTYQMLFSEVNKFAALLKSSGVASGDIVSVYLGPTPDLIISMLACWRIGAVVLPIYSGIGAEELLIRLKKSHTKFIITQQSFNRKGSVIKLINNIHKIIDYCEEVISVIVRVGSVGQVINGKKDKEIYSDDSHFDISESPPAKIDSNHPAVSFFISRGLQNNLLISHLTAGYFIQNKYSFKYIFVPDERDIIISTADLSTPDGISNSVIGPLSNGMTVLVFEGVPNYPEKDRLWKLIFKYRLSILHTSPTVLRAFKKIEGIEIDKKLLDSLRLICLYGESISRDTFLWFKNIINKKRCRIINTYQQAETGTTIAASGSGSIENLIPLPGVELNVIDKTGNILPKENPGHLIIKNAFPSYCLSDFNYNQPKIKSDFYNTNDAAVIKHDGGIKILGRTDRVVKSGSNRIGLFEIETFASTHHLVENAIAVDYPDEVKGTGICVFIKLKDGTEESILLKEELRNYISEKLGAPYKPDSVRFIKDVPAEAKLNELIDKLKKELLSECNWLGLKEKEEKKLLESLMHEL